MRLSISHFQSCFKDSCPQSRQPGLCFKRKWQSPNHLIDLLTLLFSFYVVHQHDQPHLLFCTPTRVCRTRTRTHPRTHDRQADAEKRGREDYLHKADVLPSSCLFFWLNKVRTLLFDYYACHPRLGWVQLHELRPCRTYRVSHLLADMTSIWEVSRNLATFGQPNAQAGWFANKWDTLQDMVFASAPDRFAYRPPACGA